jgi:hypothetical protein
MEIDRLLASNAVLGLVLAILLLAIGHANRSFFRDVARDPDRFWRILARAALASGAALILWISVADNWRQLIGIPYRMTQRFASKRVEIDPPSAEIRVVTIILLGLSLVLLACLVARHVGGYGIQITLFFTATMLWIPLFVLRLRFNLNLGLGFDGDATAPLDVIGYLLWVVGAWLIEIAIILSTYAVLLAAVALPVTLLLDVTRLRQPRTTNEAADFFASLSQRANSIGRH